MTRLRLRSASAAWVLLALLVGTPDGAAAAEDPPPYASFALIVGVNRSVDPDAAVLRYADDDAARYLDLFRSLGARSYVLSRLDPNTRRLHPQVAAEALAPSREELDRAVSALAADVELARQRGVKTVLYFVYAGHGNVKDGRGYLALENARLEARDLEAQLQERIRPDQTHLIVDACYSYFLTLERGPGGTRRELPQGFSMGGLARRESVGLLLSTSSARESHEWSGFEAGVFSHEVRSGLYGAADGDGDGRVSYREIAAFLHRANGAIPSARYRPDVFAHPPRSSDVLIDLRPSTRSRIEVPASLGGRYYLEDSRGIRFADFHTSARRPAYVLKPVNAGRLYLRRLEDGLEYPIPSGSQVVSLAALTPQEARTGARGAANDSFERLFALPFDHTSVDAFALKPWLPAPDDAQPLPTLPRWRLYGGTALLVAAGASTVAAVASALSARQLRAPPPAGATPADVAARDRQARSRTIWAGIGFGFGAVAGGTGLGLLLWPE
jgi:hypothetical protein